VREGARRWDAPITVVLGLLLAAAAAFAVVMAMLSAFISDACVDVTCDDARLSTGLLIALIGQPVVVLGATVAVLLRKPRGRLLFPVPLLGLLGVAAFFFGGLAIAYSAVPGANLF
jgi:hypothetical protein